MRALCCSILMAPAFSGLSGVALAQDFTGGFELVVKQHPSVTNPDIVLEVWAWSDATCDAGELFLAQGSLILDVSHPIIDEGFGSIRVECPLGYVDPSSGSWIPYCQHGIAANPPMARGTRIADFNFMQILFGGETRWPLFMDRPLHVMDIILPVTDLSPRDLIVRTGASLLGYSCETMGVATSPQLIATRIEGEAVVHVSGGDPCRADIDADGVLTIFDFLAYQNAFSAGDPIADFDGDGVLTIFDFLAFQNEFDAGCE